jgi:mRNA-degrading endonuclease RelE of RelBE toxin-antitoxin system
MDYNIVPTEQFAKDLKRLFKKYPSIKEDVVFHVAVIKVIAIIQILIGKLLFSITVPLLILVLNPQLAH